MPPQKQRIDAGSKAKGKAKAKAKAQAEAEAPAPELPVPAVVAPEDKEAVASEVILEADAPNSLNAVHYLKLEKAIQAIVSHPVFADITRADPLPLQSGLPDYLTGHKARSCHVLIQRIFSDFTSERFKFEKLQTSS